MCAANISFQRSRYSGRHATLVGATRIKAAYETMQKLAATSKNVYIAWYVLTLQWRLTSERCLAVEKLYTVTKQ